MITDMFPGNDDDDSGPSMIVVNSNGVHWSRGTEVIDDEIIIKTSSVDPVVVVVDAHFSEVADGAIAEDALHSLPSKPSIIDMLSKVRGEHTLDTLTNLTSQVTTMCGARREVLHKKTFLSKFEKAFGVSIIFLLVALALLLVGTTIALVAYFKIQSTTDTYILKTFDITATDLLSDIDRSMDRKLQDVEAIEGIVSALAGSNFLSVSEFNAMMTNFRINSSSFVAIIKRVKQADRATALSTIKSMYPSQKIIPDFWAPDLNTKKVVISPVATEYLPIYLTYPPTNIPNFTNRNMDGLRKTYGLTYTQLFSTYLTYITSIDVLVNPPYYALTFTRPIFDGIIWPSPPNVLRGQQYTGFVSVIIRYTDIFTDALSPNENMYSSINVIIRDENAKTINGSKVMFSHLNSDAPVLHPADCSYLYRKLSINLDSTTIDVYAFVSENWVSSKQSSVGWIVLFVILFLFIVIAVFIVVFGRWVYRSKRMADEKVAIAELAVSSLHMAAKYDTKACEARSETRSRTLLMAMISHELKTPINYVMGSLTVLEGVATSVFDQIKEVVKHNDDIGRIKSGEAIVRECLTDSMTALDSLHSITNDFLEMSSMKLGNFKFNKHRFDIIEAMEGEFRAFAGSTLCTKRNIKCTLVQMIYDGNDGGRVINASTKDVRDRLFVCGDDARLRQCLRVLVSNAAKFTENDRSFCVKIDLKKNSGTKLIPSKSVCSCGDVEHYDVIMVIVGVTDTGIGMNPNQTRKLFRAFEQGEMGSSDGVSFRRQFGGTGLGLSILKMFVVNGMGGLVSARSGGKGTGATFEFIFPLYVFDHTRSLESPNVSDVEVVIESDSVPTLETCKDHSGGSDITMTELPSHQKMNEVQVLDTGIDSRSISANIVHGVDNIENVVVSLPYSPDKDNNGFNVSQRERKKGLSVLEVEDVDVETPSLDPSQVQRISIVMTPTSPKIQMKNIQLRVLVVDDMEINRKVLSRMVGILGYRVDTAASGEDAVNMTESAAMHDNPFALVLMDVEMPGKYDGFQATERLRDSSVPGVRDISVVVVTAHMIDIIQDRARACGIKRCLSKPVKKNELKEVLSNCDFTHCM